jgi:hypothetical protein
MEQLHGIWRVSVRCNRIFKQRQNCLSERNPGFFSEKRYFGIGSTKQKYFLQSLHFACIEPFDEEFFRQFCLLSLL